MERLTERHVNRKGAYMACSSNCHSGPCEYCTELGKIIDRLAAYEDTGLEPAEYKKQVDAIKKLDIEHMHDLLQAEKDGRLVVLPCKVGDVVYAITSSTNIDGLESEETEETIDIFECTVESVTFYSKRSTQFRLFYQGVFVAFFVTLDDFGKTVFLTREEAEAALKNMEE